MQSGFWANTQHVLEPKQIDRVHGEDLIEALIRARVCADYLDFVDNIVENQHEGLLVHLVI